MKLKILHLYPKEMNLYADHGNVLTLIKRCEWRGIKTEVIEYEPGGKIPDDIDIIFGGGGQDSGQETIVKDLPKIAPKLKKLIENGTTTLVICGLYQLFGNFFETAGGKSLEGARILNLTTKAGPNRLIGNIVIDSSDFGEVVGYENHSGLTNLGEGLNPFGTVISGHGNNGEDQTEGARYQNCIGTYLHGPLLPKNPAVADFLIREALSRQAKKPIELKPLDDSLELYAHKVAASRPE
ncbi:glutamine amidotransferase [Candidatus Saccharibacteria bacterium]|nr:glutamine amidotransferase [Candidatus Saccharibacteria bacterium]